MTITQKGKRYVIYATISLGLLGAGYKPLETYLNGRDRINTQIIQQSNKQHIDGDNYDIRQGDQSTVVMNKTTQVNPNLEEITQGIQQLSGSVESFNTSAKK